MMGGSIIIKCEEWRLERFLMFVTCLSNATIQLIEPDVERDAPLSVQWLHGQIGRETLRLMGVVDKDITEPTLTAEQERIQSFLDRKDQLNWMIEVDGQVVGAIWVDLEPNGSVKAPGIHIMIGDPRMRGQRIGPQAMQLVIDYLYKQGHSTIYTRHHVGNTPVEKMSARLGFVPDGEPYVDSDGLEWQNIHITK